MCKREEIASKEQFFLFSTIFSIYLYFSSQITYSFVKYGCLIYFFSILQIWYVKVQTIWSILESPLDFRDNESRLYVKRSWHQNMIPYRIPHITPKIIPHTLYHTLKAISYLYHNLWNTQLSSCGASRCCHLKVFFDNQLVNKQYETVKKCTKVQKNTSKKIMEANANQLLDLDNMTKKIKMQASGFNIKEYEMKNAIL